MKLSRKGERERKERKRGRKKRNKKKGRKKKRERKRRADDEWISEGWKVVFYEVKNPLDSSFFCCSSCFSLIFTLSLPLSCLSLPLERSFLFFLNPFFFRHRSQRESTNYASASFLPSLSIIIFTSKNPFPPFSLSSLFLPVSFSPLLSLFLSFSLIVLHFWLLIFNSCKKCISKTVLFSMW